jgi:hypothetical protein
MSATWTCAECGFDIDMSYDERWICHNDLTADSTSGDGAAAQAPAATGAAATAPGWASSAPSSATTAATSALTGALSTAARALTGAPAATSACAGWRISATLYMASIDADHPTNASHLGPGSLPATPRPTARRGPTPD